MLDPITLTLEAVLVGGAVFAGYEVYKKIEADGLDGLLHGTKSYDSEVKDARAELLKGEAADNAYYEKADKNIADAKATITAQYPDIAAETFGTSEDPPSEQPTTQDDISRAQKAAGPVIPADKPLSIGQRAAQYRAWQLQQAKAK